MSDRVDAGQEQPAWRTRAIVIAFLVVAIAGCWLMWKFTSDGNSAKTSPTSTATVPAPGPTQPTGVEAGSTEPPAPTGQEQPPNATSAPTGVAKSDRENVLGLAREFMTTYLTAQGEADRRKSFEGLATADQINSQAMVTGSVIPDATIKGSPVIDNAGSARVGAPVVRVDLSDGERFYLVLEYAEKADYGWLVSMQLDQRGYEGAIGTNGPSKTFAPGD